MNAVPEKVGTEETTARPPSPKMIRLAELKRRVSDGDARTLTDGELLDLILSVGSRYSCPEETGENIMAECEGSLIKLGTMSPGDMLRFKNIGSYRAMILCAATEIGKRMMHETPVPKPSVISSRAAFEVLQNDFRGLEHEECWALYLNRANGLIAKERVSMGGVSSTTLDSRIVVRRAVELLASSIIIAHNHPSGNLIPGEYDKTMTAALRKAASLFNISLVDHIVIAGNKFFSFSDEGL